MTSTRYVAIAKPPAGHRSYDAEGWQERPSIVAVEDCPSPVKTGLLDADGVPLYWVQERVPLGFHHTPRKDTARG